MQQHHSGYRVVMTRDNGMFETQESFKWMPFDEALAAVKRLEKEAEACGLEYEPDFDCWHCQYSDGRSVTVRIEMHDSLGQRVLSGKREV